MSNTDKTSKQGSHLDFQNAATIVNLPDGVAPQQPVTVSQLNAVSATKQDNMSGGAGIDISGTSIAIDLAVTGSDYGSLTLSNTSHASLDGTYTRAAVRGTLTYAGTNLNLDVGGSFNIYYKANGGGVWAVVIKRDTDNIYGNNSVGESTGNWLAVLTTIDPTSITEDYNSFIPNYQAVDSDFITVSSEQDENGNGSPASSDSNVDYAGGSTPAGLKFENNKLAVDFASSIGNGTSTNILPASIAVTYIDEQVGSAKVSSNNSFSNTVAQLTGNPSNVQSAIEASKDEIDAVSFTVSSNQTFAASEYTKIANLQTSLAATNSDLDAAEAVTAALNSSIDTSLGLTTGGTLNTPAGNVRSDANVVQALSDLDTALAAVQGDLTSRLPAVDYLHNSLEFPLTVDQMVGIDPVDLVQTGGGTGESSDLSLLTSDVTILISYGEAGHVDAGVYTRDSSTGTISRTTHFNESSEIQKNAIMQILRGGSVAGAEFFVSTPDEPTIGADPIGFKLASANIIGEATVAELNLVAALRDKLTVKVSTDFDLDTSDGAGGYIATIVHDLGTKDVVFSIRDENDEFIDSLEVSAPTVNTLVITSLTSMTGLRITIRD